MREKLREFAAMLSPYFSDILSSGELGLPAPEETGTSFVNNAVLKAEAAAQASGLVALADDSGLCVTALGGNPGIYSARWAIPDNAAAMQCILDQLGTHTDRSAFFICVLALCWPDGHVETIEGRVNGSIALKPRGQNGHGYDPLFIPDGFDITFGEMEAARKNILSHRGRAIDAFLNRYFPSR